MSERIYKATLSQSQGREGWSAIFRNPVLLVSSRAAASGGAWGQKTNDAPTPDAGKFLHDVVEVVSASAEAPKITLR
jgi:hypothetical protein